MTEINNSYITNRHHFPEWLSVREGTGQRWSLPLAARRHSQTTPGIRRAPRKLLQTPAVQRRRRGRLPQTLRTTLRLRPLWQIQRISLRQRQLRSRTVRPTVLPTATGVRAPPTAELPASVQLPAAVPAPAPAPGVPAVSPAAAATAGHRRSQRFWERQSQR